MPTKLARLPSPLAPAALGISSNVIVIVFDKIAEGWEQWVLLSSDRHHDNPHSDHRLELEHLKRARERNALVFDFGDLFCAMQGKYDPRKQLGDIRTEDNGADYLDRIVKHAAEFYGPYADLFRLLSVGNHETAILDHSGTDLTSNLIHRLNSDHGGKIYKGGYGGWVLFQFEIRTTQRESRRLKYHHGSGGGGPVTRGVIDTNRQAVFLPDADIVVNGHTHDQYLLPIARERLTRDGVITRDLVHFVRTGTYKDEYSDGSGGFHILKGRPPKPLGAVWLRFFLRHKETGLPTSNLIGIELTMDTR